MFLEIFVSLETIIGLSILGLVILYYVFQMIWFFVSEKFNRFILRKNQYVGADEPFYIRSQKRVEFKWFKTDREAIEYLKNRRNFCYIFRLYPKEVQLLPNIKDEE
jgi:hypothetical protein